jgi:hypothetical protein
LSDRVIARFIRQKKKWIERNLARQSAKPSPRRLPLEERGRLVREANARISDRCRELSEQTGYRPARVRITGARTRWGSCGAKGTVCFTWRLIMAPPAVIDYVIIHELAHLAELNHSGRFWRLVEQHVPDHRAHRRWLRQNNQLLLC